MECLCVSVTAKINLLDELLLNQLHVVGCSQAAALQNTTYKYVCALTLPFNGSSLPQKELALLHFKCAEKHTLLHLLAHTHTAQSHKCTCI